MGCTTDNNVCESSVKAYVASLVKVSKYQFSVFKTVKLFSLIVTLGAGEWSTLVGLYHGNMTLLVYLLCRYLWKYVSGNHTAFKMLKQGKNT